MDIRIRAIKSAREELKNTRDNNIKIITVSSYKNDIEFIDNKNKLVLNFDDVTVQKDNSFDRDNAKKISDFVKKIDFKKEILYVACDSGVSRSSAIASAILRKYGEDEYIIWNDCKYHPNLLVYKILCEEFNLSNSKFRLKRKEKMSTKALKNQINRARKLSKGILGRI